MLKNLLRKLQNLAGRRAPFDPAGLNDPLALRTEWNPVKGGGSSFRTHRLVAIDHSRMEFQATAGARVFYLLFLLIGLGVSVGFTAVQLAAGVSLTLSGEILIPLLIGLVFAVTGGAMLYFGNAPIVFEMRQGWFWKGRKSPEQVFDKKGLKNFSRLDDIHALQILAEYCRGNKTSFYSYELNLVLKDGSRLNVVDHGNLPKLREDAAALALFLERPVWDALAVEGTD